MSSQAIAVVDCGYGDNGKGTTVDALARLTDTYLTVRTNGGPNALHYVVTDDEKSHGFGQFGSATFVDGVQTLLSRFMSIGPTSLIKEANMLIGLGIHRPFDRLIIDRRSPVITLYHVAANWLRELARGDQAHGTTGMGLCELMQDILNHEEDTLFAGDLLDARTVAIKTRRIRNRKREAFAGLIHGLRHHHSERLAMALRALDEDGAMCQFLDNCKYVAQRVQFVDDQQIDALINQQGTIIFEGAQGVLLDEDYGFHPHTTWSKTAGQNVETFLNEHSFTGSCEYLGVLRSYSTRHGAGPFVPNEPTLKATFPELHNSEQNWQGDFRVGWFDLVATRYAVQVAQRLNGLAITHMDRIAQFPSVRICTSYQYNGPLAAEIGTWFETQEIGQKTFITAIHPGKAGDLEYQSCITKCLMQCRPVYRDLATTNFLAFLDEELCLPIRMTSHGPTASKKSFPSLKTSAVQAA